MSLLGEQFGLLVGGVTTSSDGPRILKTHPSDTIALLDLENQHWFPLTVKGNQLVLKRAYHSTCSMDSSIFISGGCYFESGKLLNRFNALCIVKCAVNKTLKEIVIISAISYISDGLQVEKFLAQHSMTMRDGKLFLFGGLAGETGKGVKVSQLLEVCLSSETATSVPIPPHLKHISSVCGATTHCLGSSTLLFLGGSKPELGGRSNFMYTELEMAPKVCDFQKKCMVDLNFAGDLKLVGCDLCRGWYHICCDRKLDPLKLPPFYICPDCKLKQKSDKSGAHPERTPSKDDLSESGTNKVKNRRAVTKKTSDDIPDSLADSETNKGEPTYCLCDQGEDYDDMVACDNKSCPIEWFHFGCVNLKEKPTGKWFCPICRGENPSKMKPKALFLKELEKYKKQQDNKKT